jgi:hypothetical protein
VSVLRWKSPADLLGEGTPHVSVGDVIRTGENFHPHYQVIAMSEGRAWIRDTQHGTDHIVPVDQCRRI